MRLICLFGMLTLAYAAVIKAVVCFFRSIDRDATE